MLRSESFVTKIWGKGGFVIVEAVRGARVSHKQRCDGRTVFLGIVGRPLLLKRNLAMS